MATSLPIFRLLPKIAVECIPFGCFCWWGEITETILVKASEGLSTRISNLEVNFISLDAIIADAFVPSIKETYFGLAKNVISPSLASFIPQIPVITTSLSPTISPVIILAISSTVTFFRILTSSELLNTLRLMN